MLHVFWAVADVVYTKELLLPNSSIQSSYTTFLTVYRFDTFLGAYPSCLLRQYVLFYHCWLVHFDQCFFPFDSIAYNFSRGLNCSICRYKIDCFRIIPTYNTNIVSSFYSPVERSSAAFFKFRFIEKYTLPTQNIFFSFKAAAKFNDENQLSK